MPISFKGPCHCCEPPEVSNLVAQKTWYGFIGPGSPGFFDGFSHGIRYLSWASTFTWEAYAGINAGYSGSTIKSGSFGRYSGAVTRASCVASDNNPDHGFGSYHGPIVPIDEGAVSGVTTSETSIHYDWDNGSERGAFDASVGDAYTLEMLKADAQELYLQRSILDVPPNAWELLTWQAEEGGDGGTIPLPSSGFFTFSGLEDYRNVFPNISDDPASPFFWPYIRADHKTLSTEMFTGGFLLANSLSQQFDGLAPQQTPAVGLWSLVGCLFRKVSNPRNCVKHRISSGSKWDGTTASIGPANANAVLANLVPGVLDNFQTCFEKDLNINPPNTITLDPPDIVVNHSNQDVVIEDLITFGALPSGGDATCDCVGKPMPPFNISAVLGGGVVVLSWEASAQDHDINFDIYRSESSGTEGLLEHAFDHSPYIDAQVASGHTYFYKVRARNAFGVSDLSVEVSITV